MNASPGQRQRERRERGGDGLALARLHLRHLTPHQREPGLQLHIERLDVERTADRFRGEGKRGLKCLFVESVSANERRVPQLFGTALQFAVVGRPQRGPGLVNLRDERSIRLASQGRGGCRPLSTKNAEHFYAQSV